MCTETGSGSDNEWNVLTRPFSPTPGATAQAQQVGLRIEQCLTRYLSPIIARSALTLACKRLGVQPSSLNAIEEDAIMRVFDQAVSLFLNAPEKQLALAGIRRALKSPSEPDTHDIESVDIVVNGEGDATLARANALRIASAILVKPDAVKVSTVTSELARNILQYAGGGKIAIRLVREPKLGVEVVARDEGPGIANIDQILGGRYRSPTGLGLGLAGSKRLMDTFLVVTAPKKGTTVTAVKYR